VGKACYAWGVKKYLFVALGFVIAPFLIAQNEAPLAATGDPGTLLRMAAPYYDYASPDMKPWHMRYRYHYFDENGQAGGEGTFDYWWSTTKVSRATWTQGDQTRTEWHNVAGKELELVSGAGVPSMTHRLYWVMAPGFLTMKDSESDGRQLTYFTTKTSTTTLACVGSVRAGAPGKTTPSFGSVWPTYCFQEGQPVLMASRENGSLINAYGKVQRFQNHYFPGDIEILYVGKKRVEATLEESNEVAADDEVFIPAAEAKEPPPPVVIVVPKGGGIKLPVLIQRVEPIYPESDHAMRRGGTVVVRAMIGKDGKVKNAKIVSSPEASLSAAALDAVRQWRYEPGVLNGQPAEVDTTMTLNFVP
jgi:TonB family protein